MRALHGQANPWNAINLPIFFIIFRETLEASIIISVLLSLIQSIVKKDEDHQRTLGSSEYQNEANDDASYRPGSPTVHGEGEPGEEGDPEARPLIRHRSRSISEDRTGSEQQSEALESCSTSLSASEVQNVQKLVKKLRLQVFLGAGLGSLTALLAGTLLIVVYFEALADKWSNAEEIWEASCSVVASTLIFFMALAILRMENSTTKWRAKLHAAIAGHASDSTTKTSNYALFLLPFITVLREGLEAVVFVAGVALGSDPSTIPVSVLLGVLSGLGVGLAIWVWGTHSSLKLFLVFSTNALLLIGAGLASNAVGAVERYQYNQFVGGDAAEAGTGPGSYPLGGNIWHLDCCNPEDKTNGDAWAVLGSVIGWSNNGSIYTITTYIAYWTAVNVALARMMIKEGRFKGGMISLR